MFPALSVLAFTGILALLFWPLFHDPKAWIESFGSGETDETWLAWFRDMAWLFGGYLLAWILTTFFNTALAATVIEHQSSERMSLGHGFAVAMQRLPQIVMWSLFAATIGTLLSLLRDWLEGVLSWVGTFFGLALEVGFAVAMYFVAPILAVEGIGPFAALKRSASLIRQRWGATAGAEFSLFWVLWPLHAAGLALVLAWVTLYQNVVEFRSATTLVSMMAGLFAYIFLVAGLQGLLSAIVCSRLYQFASTGTPPDGSNAAVFEAAFPKKSCYPGRQSRRSPTLAPSAPWPQQRRPASGRHPSSR